MVRLPTPEFLQESGIISGLIIVQVIYAVYPVFISHLLSVGVNPLFFVIYVSFSTSILLFPFAFLFERRKWPKKFSPMLLLRLAALGVGGTTIFQSLMLLGIKNASPTVATAMPNLAPGLVFIIAVCLRLEKVVLKCIYTRVKILGTFVCLAGALTMSICQGPSTAVKNPPNAVINAGCVYLFAAVTVLSFNVVFQAAILDDFPAPLTVSASISFIGSFVTGILQFLREGMVGPGTVTISTEILVAFALVGGVAGGICTVFNSWALAKRGPVLVSMFNPLATVFSAILSALTIREGLSMRSVIGMLLMFAGLYVVLWAKKKEGYRVNNTYKDCVDGVHDAEKPLLG